MDPIAAGWGGVIAGIGPIAATSRGWPVLLAVSAPFFALGGILAGLRAVGRRIAHAIGAGLAGIAVHLGFGALTFLFDKAGGPDGASLAPDGLRGWLTLVVWCLLWAIVGGGLVTRFLGRPRHR